MASSNKKTLRKSRRRSRCPSSLAVPFQTEMLGVEVTVERVDMTDDEQIVAVSVRGKSRQRVPILELPLPDPPPEGAEWIEAFRRWARGSWVHGRRTD